MTSRPVMSIMPSMVFSLVLQALLVGKSYSQDLSILSDFSTSEIVQNGALVVQYGTANSAQILQLLEPSGGTGHYAEINQDGSAFIWSDARSEPDPGSE